MNTAYVFFGLLFSVVVLALAFTRLYRDVKGGQNATAPDGNALEAARSDDASAAVGGLSTAGQIVGDQNETFDERLMKDLRATAQGAEETPLIKALKETALIDFNVNLSKNRIVGSIVQKYEDGGSVNVLKSLGLEDNCRYTAFIEAWRAYVDAQFLSAYDEFFNVDHLIDNFQNGIPENSLIYKTFNARGEDLWAKQTMLLSQDEATRDVLAFVYALDVTAEMEKNQ